MLTERSVLISSAVQPQVDHRIITFPYRSDFDARVRFCGSVLAAVEGNERWRWMEMGGCVAQRRNVRPWRDSFRRVRFTERNRFCVCAKLKCNDDNSFHFHLMMVVNRGERKCLCEKISS